MLDLKPTDELDEADIFTSVQKLETAVLGVYQGWYPEYSILIGSVMADECRLGLRNSGVSASGQNLFRWTYSSADNEVLAPWKNAYQVIDRANRLLNGLDKVPLKNEEDQTKLEQIKGELLAIRAYEHFDLYRIYASTGVYHADAYAVPYMIKSSTASQPSRLHSASFFSFFWQDINDAETLLEYRSSNIRMGLTAVYALHARAALYTGKYAEAAEYAGKVIEKAPLASPSDFTALWKDQSDAEVVFKLKRTNLSTMRPGDIFYNISAERILFAPALKLMSLYDKEHDVRYKSYFETNPDLVEQGDLPEIVVKYRGEEGAQNKNDIKVFRTGEMYLIRAEAALENNDLVTAEDDINVLRLHRIENYGNEHFNNAMALKNAIAIERYKELPYEGHRYYDLKRLNNPVERNLLDAESGFMLLPQTATSYYLPIPQAEILANPNIRPNNNGW